MSLLCTIARRGDVKDLVELLSSSASMDVNETDERGDTPLHWAVFCDHAEVCEQLLRHGADWSRRSGRRGQTPLHDAAWDGDINILKCLLAFGIDVNITSNTGIVAAHEAAYRGHTEFLQLLALAGANMKLRCSNGKTPSDTATWGKHQPIQEWLNEFNKNPMRLQELCRIRIRHEIDNRQMQQLEDLPLPSHLIQYLQFHYHSYIEARESDDAGIEIEET